MPIGADTTTRVSSAPRTANGIRLSVTNGRGPKPLPSMVRVPLPSSAAALERVSGGRSCAAAVSAASSRATTRATAIIVSGPITVR